MTSCLVAGAALWTCPCSFSVAGAALWTRGFACFFANHIGRDNADCVAGVEHRE